MQTNYDLGMRTLAQSLEDIVRQKRISAKTAQLYLE
jgi:Tfp pilus assembly pilus retraction ATPase PilT